MLSLENVKEIKEEDKPCPFCGNHGAWDEHPVTCYLKLMDLDETGEKSPSVTEFREAWNRRTTPQDTRR